MKNLIRVIAALLILFFLLSILGDKIFAQSTTIKLSTNDNTSRFEDGSSYLGEVYNTQFQLKEVVMI